MNIIKKPSECTKKQLNDFYLLMVESGEVSLSGLKERIKDAHLLAFNYEDDNLTSIAALKNPSGTYRWKITTEANFPLDKKTYPYELGWIFTNKDYRNQRKSQSLLTDLRKKVNTKLFATVKESNGASIHLLKKFGFNIEGNKYKSMNGKDYILLMIT